MSKRTGLYVVLPLAAAAASLVVLVLFALDNLLRPSWPPATSIAWYAAFAVIVAAVAIAMGQMETGRRAVLAACLAVIVAAGFLPRVADYFAVVQEQAEEQAEGADAEMEFQSSLLGWSDDIATRVAERRPYTADEGMAFLDFAAGADLTWRSLPDHTPQAFALVREALATGILDPDSLTTGAPVADSPALTLTLLWYDRRVRSGSPKAVEKHAWEILQILVASGADIAGDDAAALRADLAKTVIQGDGRFIRLEWGEAEPVAVEPPAGAE